MTDHAVSDHNEIVKNQVKTTVKELITENGVVDEDKTSSADDASEKKKDKIDNAENIKPNVISNGIDNTKEESMVESESGNAMDSKISENKENNSIECSKKCDEVNNLDNNDGEISTTVISDVSVIDHGETETELEALDKENICETKTLQSNIETPTEPTEPRTEKNISAKNVESKVSENPENSENGCVNELTDKDKNEIPSNDHEEKVSDICDTVTDFDSLMLELDATSKDGKSSDFIEITSDDEEKLLRSPTEKIDITNDDCVLLEKTNGVELMEGIEEEENAEVSAKAESDGNEANKKQEDPVVKDNAETVSNETEIDKELALLEDSSEETLDVSNMINLDEMFEGNLEVNFEKIDEEIEDKISEQKNKVEMTEPVEAEKTKVTEEKEVENVISEQQNEVEHTEAEKTEVTEENKDEEKSAVTDETQENHVEAEKSAVTEEKKEEEKSAVTDETQEKQVEVEEKKETEQKQSSDNDIDLGNKDSLNTNEEIENKEEPNETGTVSQEKTVNEKSKELKEKLVQDKLQQQQKDQQNEQQEDKTAADKADTETSHVDNDKDNNLLEAMGSPQSNSNGGSDDNSTHDYDDGEILTETESSSRFDLESDNNDNAVELSNVEDISIDDDFTKDLSESNSAAEAVSKSSETKAEEVDKTVAEKEVQSKDVTESPDINTDITVLEKEETEKRKVSNEENADNNKPVEKKVEVISIDIEDDDEQMEEHVENKKNDAETDETEKVSDSEPPSKRPRIDANQEMEEGKNIEETQSSIATETTDNTAVKEDVKDKTSVIVEDDDDDVLITSIEQPNATANKRPASSLSADGEILEAAKKSKLEETETKSELAETEIKHKDDLDPTEQKEKKLEIILDPKPKEVEKRSLPLEFMKKFKKPFDKMNRKDLEELVLQKIVEAIVHKSDYSELRTKCEAQEQVIQSFRVKIQELSKQFRDLEMVHNRVVKDLENKNQSFVTPVKITRAVGLQVCLLKRDHASSAGTAAQLQQPQQLPVAAPKQSPAGLASPVHSPITKTSPVATSNIQLRASPKLVQPSVNVPQQRTNQQIAAQRQQFLQQQRAIKQQQQMQQQKLLLHRQQTLSQQKKQNASLPAQATIVQRRSIAGQQSPVTYR